MLSIIFPCRDERESIGVCVNDAFRALRGLGISGEVVVSDSSSDGSDAIAEARGARVVRHGREGYGRAIREGVRAAHGEIIAYADADGTYCLEALPELLAALETAELVIGSRLRGRIAKGAMPPLHRFLGTPFLNALLALLLGIRVSDSQSGFRVMRKETFDALGLKTEGMEFATEMIVKARRMGARIAEVPVNYRFRRGTSKLRPYRDGLAHLKYILLQTSFGVYFGGGVFFLLLGALGFFAPLPTHPTLTSLARIALPLIGIEILFLGLFARTYFVSRFDESSPALRRFYARFRIPSALLLGMCLVLVATLVIVLGVSRNPDLPLLLFLAGFQIPSNALLLSMLSIKYSSY